MATSGNKATPITAFELKGRVSTLTVLRLLDPDPATVLSQLDQRLSEAPAMFAGMPLAIDGSGLDSIPETGRIEMLVRGLRERGLAPVALVGDVDRETAIAAGLGVMPERAAATPQKRAEEPSEPEEPEPEARAGAARLVTQPVRSGQQVYARGGDLVVLATVSPGAEVLADGHIHIYGSLNGRALAGVQGDETARIFCHRLNAELIAIAGRYQISDNFDESDRGSEVQIYLRDDALCIEPLPAAS